jgi:CCR4-NOT transcription complex subunit 7/8
MIKASCNDSQDKITASGKFKTPDGQEIEIRDVWASNFDAEMEIIRELIQDYPFVAMVTIFLE